jgi:hypothetical protein
LLLGAWCCPALRATLAVPHRRWAALATFTPASAAHAELAAVVMPAPAPVMTVVKSCAAADADHKTGNCCHRSDAPLPESVKEMFLRCLSHLSWRST